MYAVIKTGGKQYRVAEGQKLSPNYISELLTVRIDDLTNPAPVGPETSLLKVLLPHAYLRQHAEAAARVHGRAGANVAHKGSDAG